MSAIDEYCEAIPAAGGDRGQADRDRGGQPIAPATRRALERSAAGRSILALSAAPANAKPHKAAGGAPAGTSQVTPNAPSDNVVESIARDIGHGGGTVGPAFGTFLLLLALAFFATAWLRYRRRGQT